MIYIEEQKISKMYSLWFKKYLKSIEIDFHSSSN